LQWDTVRAIKGTFGFRARYEDGSSGIKDYSSGAFSHTVTDSFGSYSGTGTAYGHTANFFFNSSFVNF